MGHHVAVPYDESRRVTGIPSETSSITGFFLRREVGNGSVSHDLRASCVTCLVGRCEQITTEGLSCADREVVTYPAVMASVVQYGHPYVPLRVIRVYINKRLRASFSVTPESTNGGVTFSFRVQTDIFHATGKD